MRRSDYIDQWRGISVLMVIVDHLFLFRLPVLKGPLEAWAHGAGMVGVCIFFAISGHLITTLLLKEEARDGRFSLAGFYARRIFRIVPALVVLLLTVRALDALGAVKLGPNDALGPTLFLCNTKLVDCGHLGHFWSLAVEEQFYMFWPLLMLTRWRLPVAIVTFAVALVCSAIPGLRIDGWMNNGLAFSCISIGVIYAHKPIRIKAPGWLLYGLLLSMPYLMMRRPSPVWVVLLPFLIVATVLARSGRVIPALKAVGLVSYSLYLWHALFTWPPASYKQEWFVYASLLAIPAAWLSYRYVEQPFIALGKRLLARVNDETDVRQAVGSEAQGHAPSAF